jgi:NTP pyrophosphatase (non-canonical NTP hydrolase)
VKTLKEIQVEVHEWAERNFPGHSYQDTKDVIEEELGELTHHLLKQRQGIRGSWKYHENRAQDAVGDLLLGILHLCQDRGWDAQQILEEVWAEVQTRDWIGDPVRGGSSQEASQR